MSFRPDGYSTYIEIIVREGSGAKIERDFAHINNPKDCKRVLKWLVEKYGFGESRGTNILDPTITMFLDTSKSFIDTEKA